MADTGQTKMAADLQALHSRVEELERAAQALHEDKERYRAVFEQAADSIVLLDPLSGEILEFNERTPHNLGYTREEFQGLGLVDIEAIESAEDIARHTENIIREGSDTFETKHRRKDGTLRDMLVSTVVVSVQRRQLIASIWRDITDRKRAEEALRKERDFSAKLLQASPTFFVGLSADGRTLMMNEAMLTSLGYTEDEVIGTNYMETFVPQSERGQLTEVFNKLVSSNEPTVNENLVHTKDGRELLVEWHGMPLFNENDEFDFFFGVGIDVTERRQAEEERRALESQMQHAQKLESLGVLAGGIAHDFNNLLVSVLGNASLMLNMLPAGSREWELSKEIEQSACRAADLTKQMLAYSGKGKFVVATIDLSKLVEEMAQFLQVSISKKAVLKLDFPRDLPAVEADATQLRQVVMNLITNASEAIGDHEGLITVRTGVTDIACPSRPGDYLDDDLPAGAYVFVEVTDTGCGMREEVRAKIFDPFFTTKFTGRGLGLAAVQGIVRGHNGAIKIQSRHDHGTTVRVLLPASDRTASPAPADDKPPTKNLHGAWTVLVVDDEEFVLLVTTRILEQSGCTVLTARDGRDALAVFREHSAEIDAVVLDMTMPDLGGDDVFREMRRMRADLRVVLTSGYNEQEATNRFAGQGLAGFLQKPYRADTLIEKLDEVMKA